MIHIIRVLCGLFDSTSSISIDWYVPHDGDVVIFINIFQTSCHLQGKNSNIKISKAQKVIIIIIIIIVISHMS